LNLSHDLNTDIGRDYCPLNQDEWNQLLGQLTGEEGLKHLFVAPNPTLVDLSTLPLNQFIGTNQAAVLIIVRPDNNSITLGDYHHRGAYNYSQMSAYKLYSNTHELERMVKNQLQKMRDHRTSPDSPLFLLSWTLTQNPAKVFGGPSILALSEKALPRIYTDLIPACSNNTYPNILYLNGFDSNDITALTMAINGIAAMAGGTAATAEGTAEAAEGVAATAEGTAVTTEGTTTMTQDMAARTQGTAATAEGIVVTVEGIAAPVGGIAATANGSADPHLSPPIPTFLQNECYFGMLAQSQNVVINGGQFIHLMQQGTKGMNLCFDI